MQLKLEQLPAALERGLSSVYLFGGPEPLLLQECRDMVWNAAREQGFLEREVIHAGGRFDWSALDEAGGTQSLFASKRLIDLRLPSGKPGHDGAKALTKWLNRADPDLLLMVSCDQWDGTSRKAKWAGALEKAGTRVDIWPVKSGEMPACIRRRMQAVGLQPDQGAVMLLAQRLEGNLLAAQQEIDKLLLLKGQGAVTEEEVLQAVVDSARFDAVHLVERVFEGDLADGLRVVSGLRRMGMPLQLVVGALLRDLRILEAFRLAMSSGQNEAAAFRQLKIWSSRQKPLQAAARRIDQHRLFNAFTRLALIDRQGKGQAPGNPWHNLDRLVCELCAN
jgi:DNA polymerase-3 subunit delta